MTDPVLSDLERELYRTGIYGKVHYSITRDGIPLGHSDEGDSDAAGSQPAPACASSG